MDLLKKALARLDKGEIELFEVPPYRKNPNRWQLGIYWTPVRPTRESYIQIITTKDQVNEAATDAIDPKYRLVVLHKGAKVRIKGLGFGRT